MIIEGVVGSMAWRFDGAVLRVVRFSLNDNLWRDVSLGKQLATYKYKPHVKHRGTKDTAVGA